MLVQKRQPGNTETRNSERGAALFVAIAALVWVIIPMLGLFVDLGILYSAKARLQAGVDGAALAAARALNLGQTTAAQAVSAQQNAVNWFYANFPNGNWATFNTVMTTANVTVVNSPNNANLRQVTVTASTSVPTWFMKYLGFSATTLTSSGQASRKDLIAMLVLDRSGSMCAVNGVAGSQPCSKSNSNTACAAMIIAAKVFTGFFAEGRDQIGLLTFSDGYYLDHAPTTNFQTLFGYTNSSSGNGMIDNITCGGGTGTAAAMSLAYNELYKINEPGAMNLIMLETDGLPNTLVYNFYTTPGTLSTLALNTTSACVDNNNLTYGNNGWRTSTSARQWITGIPMNTGGSGYMANVPAGSIGGFYTSDPAQGTYIDVLFNPNQSSDSSGSSNSVYLPNANGCKFDGVLTATYGTDLNWLPGQDVFGNQVAPSNEYVPLALTSGYNNLTGTANTDWPHTHAAALNATDNAAYNIRTNATLPAYVFTIGLGGNDGNPPDPILLQRMANDPNEDQFNNPPVFPACSSEPACITYSSQPQGTFIYAPTSAQLGQAFLSISSQILRLSH
jgi:Flp pilus assembly protein TadG